MPPRTSSVDIATAVLGSVLGATLIAVICVYAAQYTKQYCAQGGTVFVARGQQSRARTTMRKRRVRAEGDAAAAADAATSGTDAAAAPTDTASGETEQTATEGGETTQTSETTTTTDDAATKEKPFGFGMTSYLYQVDSTGKPVPVSVQENLQAAYEQMKAMPAQVFKTLTSGTSTTAPTPQMQTGKKAAPPLWGTDAVYGESNKFLYNENNDFSYNEINNFIYTENNNIPIWIGTDSTETKTGTVTTGGTSGGSTTGTSTADTSTADTP